MFYKMEWSFQFLKYEIHEVRVTFDLMPHIGEIDGIYYANGYSGHGLSIATYLGTELGLLLTGKKKTGLKMWKNLKTSGKRKLITIYLT